MTTKTTKSGIIDAVVGDPAEEQQKELVDRLAGLLPREGLEDALKGLDPEQITGPGGLLTQLAGRVIETALGAELTEHLGYPPGQAPPGGAGNVRNGSTGKTVQTEPGRFSRRLRVEDVLSSGQEILRGCHDLGSIQMS